MSDGDVSRDYIQKVDLLTIKQVAVYLQVSESKVRGLIREKKLPRRRIGGRLVRIRRVDLEAFVDGLPHVVEGKAP